MLRRIARTTTLLALLPTMSDATWSQDEQLTFATGASTAPAIAAGPSGEVHAVWLDYRDGIPDAPEIYYKRREPVGWTQDERLTTAPGGGYGVPCVAVTSDGALHVIWPDSRSGDQELYYKRFDGTAWTEDLRLTDTAGISIDPKVCADAQDRLHLVWSDSRDGNREIYYKRWDGAAWGPDQRLTNESRRSTRPAVACSPSGTIHVLWEDDRRNPNQSMDIFHKRWDGLSWSSDLLMTEGTVDNWNSSPVAVATDDGSVHVVWRTNLSVDTYALEYARWAGAWSPNSYLFGEAAGYSMAADPSGNLHLCFAYFPWWATEFPLYHSVLESGSWTPAESLSVLNYAYQTSMAIDSNGAVSLAWSEDQGGNEEIYSKRRGGTETDIPILPSGLPEVLVAVAPNPFRFETKLELRAPKDARTEVRLYDAAGREVSSLWSGVVSSQPIVLTWRAIDSSGRALPPGNYFLRMETEAGAKTSRVTILR